MAKSTKNELFRQYSELYFKEIQPKLDAYEKQRKDEMPVHFLLLLLKVFAVLGLVTGFLVYFNVLPAIYTGICWIIVGISAVIMLSWKNKYFDKEYKDRNGITHYIRAEKETHFDIEMLLKSSLMPKVTNIFGNFRWQKGTYYNNNEDFKKFFKNLFVFPKYNNLRFDDCFSGSEDNVHMEIYETYTNMFPSLGIFIACVILGGFLLFFPFIFFTIFLGVTLKIWGLILDLLLILVLIFFLFKKFVSILNDGVFRGLVVSYSLPKKFKGKTFLYENKPSNLQIHTKLKTGFEKVNLEDVVFNNNYIVYSDDQIEARYLLSAGFIERFNNIKTAFKASYVRAEFLNGKLYLVIGVNKDLFQMGNIYKKTDASTFNNLFEELWSVIDLGRELKVSQNTGL